MIGIEKTYILLLKKLTVSGKNFVILFFLSWSRGLWLNQKKMIISTIQKICLNTYKLI